ncbi:MAG: DoxX family protein [Paludibacter sp.]|nr:DoxX family protein [Paludibacter sp.]
MENTTKSTCCGISNDTLVSYGLVVLRLAAGIFMLTHGWQKLSNFDTFSAVFPDPIGLGSGLSLGLIVFAEFFCSILLILGLFTRLAAIPLVIGMAVAAFVMHGADPFAAKELSLLYLFIYLALIFTGPGRHSVDYVLRNVYAKIQARICKK